MKTMRAFLAAVLLSSVTACATGSQHKVGGAVPSFGSGGVHSVKAGTNVTVTGTPSDPIVNSSGGGGGAVSSVSGTNHITCSPTTGAVGCSDSGLLVAASNLGDVSSASAARTNLGLAPVAASGSASDLSLGTLSISRIADASITFAKVQNIAAASLFGNPTGSSAVGQGITLGAGLNFSGSTLVNSAAFGPDVSVQLNNSTPAAVTASEWITTLTTTTPGSEASDFTLKLLSGGAQFTSMYHAPTGFIGIGTATTNSSSFAAGSRGITVLSTGNGTQAALELKSGNASGTQSDLAEINVWNGATKAGRMTWDNVGSTTASQLTVRVGVGAANAYIFSSGGFTSPGATSTSTLSVASGNWTVNTSSIMTSAGRDVFNTNVVPIQFTAGSTGQALEKSGGGSLTLRTVTADSLILGTNSTARITINSTGQEGFFNATPVSQQTVGANVNNVASSGTTGQFDDFTSGTVYSTDYASLHATVYQLTRSVAQLTVGFRNLGFGN